jgi:hypothetical protein
VGSVRKIGRAYFLYPSNGAMSILDKIFNHKYNGGRVPEKKLVHCMKCRL